MAVLSAIAVHLLRPEDVSLFQAGPKSRGAPWRNSLAHLSPEERRRMTGRTMRNFPSVLGRESPFSRGTSPCNVTRYSNRDGETQLGNESLPKLVGTQLIRIQRRSSKPAGFVFLSRWIYLVLIWTPIYSVDHNRPYPWEPRFALTFIIYLVRPLWLGRLTKLDGYNELSVRFDQINLHINGCWWLEEKIFTALYRHGFLTVKEI